MVGVWSVSDLDPRAETFDYHVDNFLVLSLETFRQLGDQIHQEAQLNLRAVLRIHELLQCSHKILFFIVENLHEVFENEIFLLLISEEEKGNPLINGLLVNFGQTDLFRVHNSMVDHQLIQFCISLQLLRN